MNQLSTRHLLGIKNITEEDIHLIFETADNFKEVINRPIKKVPNNNSCQYKPNHFADQAKPISMSPDKPFKSTNAKPQNNNMKPAVTKNTGLLIWPNPFGVSDIDDMNILLSSIWRDLCMEMSFV